jgi:hypothetical protein
MNKLKNIQIEIQWAGLGECPVSESLRHERLLALLSKILLRSVKKNGKTGVMRDTQDGKSAVEPLQ